jgi:recombination protein RecT
MSGTTTSQALATVDKTPRALVKKYEASFAAVLPSHITKPETWIRLAQGALKKGKKDPRTGLTDLEVAAANNPDVFLAALLDCARQGLEPGTEQYYLTPRKVKGRLEILGIVGYQGYIELMYRAGAVSSVTAECVYSNDRFTYQPGRDEIPAHEVDWDSDDRGTLRLVYAFAKMKDGAYSKVIVLNKAAITRIKAKSQGADSDYSPWQTSPDAMWLKSAIRQLRKWVPTSSEYIREQLRAVRDVAAEGPSTNGDGVTVSPGLDDLPAPPSEFDDDDIADAEILDDGRPFTEGD